MKITATLNELKQNPWLIRVIPQENITLEMSLIAAKYARRKLRSNQTILQFIPLEFRTKEVCYHAVKNNGKAISDVPEKLRDELYKIAVQQCGEVLCDINKSKRTPELCMCAVEDEGMAILFVPQELLTYEIAYTAVHTTPKALQYVPDHFKDLDLCLMAVLRGGMEAHPFVPEELLLKL